jgi:hypothetical protein
MVIQVVATGLLVGIARFLRNIYHLNNAHHSPASNGCAKKPFFPLHQVSFDLGRLPMPAPRFPSTVISEATLFTSLLPVVDLHS